MTTFASTVEVVNEIAATTPRGTLSASGFVGPNPIDSERRRYCWYAAGPLPAGWAASDTERPITYNGGTTWTTWGARRRLHRAMHRLAGGDPLLAVLSHVAHASDALAVLFALAASVVAMTADRRAVLFVVLAWAGAVIGHLARRTRRVRVERASIV